MKMLLPCCLAGLAMLAISPTASAQPAAPAAATAVPKKFVPGLATVNVQDVVASSKAVINAAQERQIVYKTQFAMAEARRQQINGQIQPLMAKFNADRQAGNVSQADLQQQAQAIQGLQQAGVQELQTMLAPIALSETFVQEQVTDVINRAITDAMDKNGVTFVLPQPNVLAYNNGYNLSPAVLAELDRLLPVAKVVPPQGWQPRAVREAQAAQAAQIAKPSQPAKPAQPARRIP